MTRFTTECISSPIGLLAVLVILVSPANAGKILLAMSSIVNTPSQHIVVSAVTEPLVAKGHEVVLLAPENKITKGLTSEAVTDRIYFTSNKTKEELENVMKSITGTQLRLSKSSFLGVFKLLKEKLFLLTEGCTSLFKDNKTLKVLQEERFDLIITQPLIGCDMLLAEYLNVPFVVVSPMRRSVVVTEDHFRIPIPSSYVPFSLFTAYSDQMTFKERVRNSLMRFIVHPMTEYLTTYTLQGIKREFNIRPDLTLSQLTAEAMLWLSYSNFALEFPQPTATNWIPIGGITAKPAKELPQVSDICDQ